MNIRTLVYSTAAAAGVLLISASAYADPWKDESGHGRGGPPPWAGRGGEPPDWARGKGVWDGHFKHQQGGPPPWAGRGEPPDWARGRGVWDGHFKHWQGGPPPWAGRGREGYFRDFQGYGVPMPYGGYYAPRPFYNYGQSYYYGW